MPKKDEQTPGRNPNPQPQRDHFGRPDGERKRQPGTDRDAEEEDEEL